MSFGCQQQSRPVASSAASKAQSTSEPSELPAHRPVELPHDGYVSSEACLECHSDEHASWSDSFHRTMTQVVTPETVLGKFDGQQREFYGWRFRPERRGDEFWMRIEATSQKTSFDHRLVMSTGSHHMQKYWYETGSSRKLGLAPLVYLIESDRWVPEHTAFLRPTESGLPFREGNWNQGCNQCHATGSLPRIRSADEMDTLVAEFGISCEACHGPGERHAADKSADSIVNPRKLSAKASSQVCGQCHGAWVMKEDAGDNWSSEGHTYRPGDDLFATRYFVHGANKEELHEHIKAEDSFWPDGEVRVAGREFNGLISSPCYAHNRGDDQRMSCITCHDLHNLSATTPRVWADDLLAPNMRSNEACLQCHQTLRSALAEHTHHAPESAGSLCYNCHMPHTSYGLLKAVRSHTITSPSVAETVETGRPNACNQCHLDQTLEWTANQLASMYGHRKPQLTSEHRAVAASVLAALKGDAAQRALTAWTMGWEKAHEVSGTDWIVFYLMDLMFDDYDAIRYIAHRSLTRIRGFESIRFDHMRPQQERARVMDEVFAKWQSVVASGPTEARLLFDESGNVRMRDFQFLRQQRDNRKVVITE